MVYVALLLLVALVSGVVMTYTVFNKVDQLMGSATQEILTELKEIKGMLEDREVGSSNGRAGDGADDQESAESEERDEPDGGRLYN